MDNVTVENIVWAGLLACVLVVAAVEDVPAHQATPTASQPLGWAYDYTCCSLNDCREVKDTSVSVSSKGYTIEATGEVIGYKDSRVKRSKDEFYHWCSVAGGADSRTICLYVPDRGY